MLKLLYVIGGIVFLAAGIFLILSGVFETFVEDAKNPIIGGIICAAIGTPVLLIGIKISYRPLR